jgi:branched-chain amino acid transport system ATP-binding protein
MSSAEVALETRALVAGYSPDIPVVREVSIEARPGQVAALIGPNGAGKSTLLKAILGIVRVHSGAVLLGGDDVTGTGLETLARRGVGYVPQSDDVFDTLRVSENLDMGGYLLPKPARAARVEAVLESFPHLRSRLNRYVGTMSGGERKMTAVARALMLSPRVLLLDEPTAGLSPELTNTVLQTLVRRLADAGHAVLLVEQKAAAALEIADWAYLLVRGSVVRSAPASDMLASSDLGELFLGGGLKSLPW